jgi:hypothetical protein
MDKINPKEWDSWNRSLYRKQAIQERLKAAQLTQEQQNEQALRKIREIRSRLKEAAE